MFSQEKFKKITLYSIIGLCILFIGIPIILYGIYSTSIIFEEKFGPQPYNLNKKLSEIQCSKGGKIEVYEYFRIVGDDSDWDVYFYKKNNVKVFVGGNESGEGMIRSNEPFSKNHKDLVEFKDYSRISYDLKDNNYINFRLELNNRYVTKDDYSEIQGCITNLSPVVKKIEYINF